MADSDSNVRQHHKNQHQIDDDFGIQQTTAPLAPLRKQTPFAVAKNQGCRTAVTSRNSIRVLQRLG